jgi:single-strand DNA-binding protein
MSFINHVTLLGNLASDPEMRYTSGGTQVASFTLATNEQGSVDKETGERKKNTNFHRIVVWGKLAESVSTYLKKGRQVLVEGRIQYRNYEDKEGVKRKSTEIVSRNVQFLGSPQKAEADASPTPAE